MLQQVLKHLRSGRKDVILKLIEKPSESIINIATWHYVRIKFAVKSKQTHLASERPSQPPNRHVDGALLDAERGGDRHLHRVHVLR